MNVSFLTPLETGWQRMKTTLFGPFDLMKWIALGFAAWLARLVDSSGWEGGGRSDASGHGPFFRGAEGVADVVRHIAENAFWLPIIGFVILLGFVIYGILLWVSSRAKFVYLDDVVHNRSRITQPWSEFGTLADSLFKWRLVFGVLVFLVVSAFIVPIILAAGIDAVLGWPGALTVPAVLTLVVMALFIGVPVAYVGLFLDDFVVPIMYRDGLPVTAAWRKFLALFQDHLGYFLVYGLFVLALHIALAFAVMVLALFTCCVGALVLAIPYVGTVLMLPVWVTYRVYSLEFLAQFDPHYRFFETTGAQTPAS